MSPGYTRTIGLRVLQGRSILDTDVAGSTRVAVVNEAMAQAFWPDQDPLQGCFYIGDTQECTGVVGVVEDTALGAHKARILRGVVVTGARLAVFGVLLGTAISMATAPLVRDLLFLVDSAEPTLLGVVALLLLGVALVASLVPGLRATRVEPMEALRSE